MTDQLFSNYGYYKNERFTTLLRSYNSCNENIQKQGITESLETWAIMIQDDFYTYSVEWFEENYDNLEWKIGLE